MRRDPESGQMVPHSLGEYLTFFEGVLPPNEKAQQMKDTVLEAIRLLTNNVLGGPNAEMKLTHRQACDLFLEKGLELARSKAANRPTEVSDELLGLAAAAIATGDRTEMLKLADRITEAAQHPTVHPLNRASALKLAGWLRLNAQAGSA